MLSHLNAEEESETEGGTNRRDPSDRLACPREELENAQPEEDERNHQPRDQKGFRHQPIAHRAEASPLRAHTEGVR